jgi:hypothetical protein
MAEPPVNAREQIMVAVHTLLQTLTGVGVYRNLSDPIPSGGYPAIILMDGDHEQEIGSTNESRYTMTFGFFILLQATGGIAPGTELNAMWARLVVLMHSDGSLGGRVSNLQEVGLLDTDIEESEGRATLQSTEHRWQCQFHTPVGDPFTLLTS